MSKVLNPNDGNWRCLVAAARDRRGDDTPRLVLCDHIDDIWTGDPLIDFIRSQIDISRRMKTANALGQFGWEWTSPEFNREMGVIRDLLARTWLQYPFFKEVPEHLQHQWRWVRGFPDQVVCEWNWWVKWWPTLTAMGPVGEVFFVTYPRIVIEHYDITDTYGFWADDQELLREVGKQEYMVSGQEFRSMPQSQENDLYYRVASWTMRQVWPEDGLIAGLTVDPLLDDLLVPDEPWRLGAARSP